MESLEYLGGFIPKIMWKLTKAFLYTAIAGFMFLVITIGCVMVDGYVVIRSAMNNILEYAADENCLAVEQVYLSSSGNRISVQDMVRNMLENYEANSWYLSFDTTGDFIGLSDDCAVTIYYEDGAGNRVSAESYDTVCQRGTDLYITLRGEISVAAWSVATRYDGTAKAPGSRGTLIKIPIHVNGRIVATREYKGLDLIRGR